ncbi:MAG: CBS domain-containing protein [Planctomycetota bacterium]|jgi:CBS domain-containing protein|nr:CBS domain-containing protein [Planctomycetota bacterium]MDP6506348.1 CBS domain-containing protein [Planctomycetota bacterium]
MSTAAKPLNAEDIMQHEIVTADVDETASKLSSRMSLNDIHHIPILDDGFLLGVVSTADIEMVTRCSKLVPNLAKLVRASDIMSTPPVTAKEDASVEEVINLMIENNVRSIVIARSEEELLGIVTHTDIMRLCADLLQD